MLGVGGQEVRTFPYPIRSAGSDLESSKQFRTRISERPSLSLSMFTCASTHKEAVLVLPSAKEARLMGTHHGAFSVVALTHLPLELPPP